MLNLILVIITNSILFPLKLSRYLDAEPHASCEFFNFLSLFLYCSPWPQSSLIFSPFPYLPFLLACNPPPPPFFIIFFYIFLVLLLLFTSYLAFYLACNPHFCFS
ncbi:unnamed protein product, partial [Prunus brigantina]